MSGTGDYISREAALEAVWQILNGMGYSEKHNDRLVEEVDAILDDIPAADVRPVIFCRDCTFFKPQQKSKRWSSATPMCSRSATIKMPPDGFCSFGVKREES